jgi:hypothetical protein
MDPLTNRERDIVRYLTSMIEHGYDRRKLSSVTRDA